VKTSRHELVDLLDSRLYRRLIKDFSKFLTASGDGAKAIPKDDGTAHTGRTYVADKSFIIGWLRYVPMNSVLGRSGCAMLHALRIELKQLRYTLSLFSEVLGPQAAEYIEEVKTYRIVWAYE